MRIVKHSQWTSEESFAFITANIAAKITKQPIIRPTILILLLKNRQHHQNLPNGKKLLEEQLHTGYAPAYRCRTVLVHYHSVCFQELSGHAGYGHVYSVAHILVAEVLYAARRQRESA
jgi:hypothetical protein